MAFKVDTDKDEFLFNVINIFTCACFQNYTDILLTKQL